MEEMKRHLGHSTIRVTSDHYGHLFPEARQALADDLDRLMRRLPAASAWPEASVTRLLDANQGTR